MCGARRAANSRSSICSWCWHSQERFSYRSFSTKPRRMPSTSQVACTWARRMAERREPWSKRRAKLCVADDDVPTREHRMIERVAGVHPEIGGQMIAPAESAPGGGVQAELGRAGDGVAPRVTPLV